MVGVGGSIWCRWVWGVSVSALNQALTLTLYLDYLSRQLDSTRKVDPTEAIEALYGSRDLHLSVVKT